MPAVNGRSEWMRHEEVMRTLYPGISLLDDSMDLYRLVDAGHIATEIPTVGSRRYRRSDVERIAAMRNGG